MVVGATAARVQDLIGELLRPGPEPRLTTVAVGPVAIADSRPGSYPKRPEM